ncbi:xylulokinase [Ruminococcus gauvreauii]|uniref:Xylulose kinase n=1 Tax=Ruminococcus gauvreauii TaxID=438033 RepID=A0ABY5VEJ8_9FIRM|nr:xylulokinase [Ruminococcus gauvreauii]UWP58687.1 xylulokinase [Ruminococcus gauvreauii]
MLYIGIDLGTSAVKLLLMDEKGTIYKTVSREYPLYFPRPGWSQQDPEDWFVQTMNGLLELTDGADKGSIRGISFGGQMHGLVVLDDRDRVIRPAILWNDGRTGEETDYLNHQIGQDKLSEYTANIAFAGFTAPKILWLAKHEPENFKRISKIMLPKDYLAYRLSGEFCTDMSDASGMLLLNVKERCWSEEMLSLCGITAKQLPKLYESYEPVGTLKPQIADELGLPHTVKVIAGAGDNAAAAVGTGTVGDGMCNLSLGTSGTIFISSDTFGVDENNALHSFAHADGHYHLMGCMLSAASCNKWWNDDILKTSDYAAEQKNITRLGENQVFYLPYLMGERSPHNDPNARAVFLGMTMDTAREDMTQAVLEGVAFALRDSLEVARSLGIQITRTKICGGGAKSPLWKTIIANVMNLKVDVPETEEGPALGAAMLAAVGCGEYPDVISAADAIVKVVQTVEPDPALAAKYEARYQKFRTLYPALKDIF